LRERALDIKRPEIRKLSREWIDIYYTDAEGASAEAPRDVSSVGVANIQMFRGTEDPGIRET
jgi:hypothetical protein